MAVKPDSETARGVAIVGSSCAALQTALTLARLGVEVKLITDSVALGGDANAGETSDKTSADRRYLWPLLLQATRHPLITIYTGSEIEEEKGEKGNFRLRLLQHPGYINEELCAACGRCESECSVQVTSTKGDQKIKHGAIHAPLLDKKAVPSSYVIDKNGVAPCHTECPLGINVQGFISLLSKDKKDKALALISKAAPLAGILGRVCTHPCENKCNRAEIDSAVSIRALHRFAADNASLEYIQKQPAKSRTEKIAIIGSGPAGLTAAWELTRRGYSPTVFESHGVIGGMVATGIPRFRLPKEIREKEIEAIKNLGVDIRTGITVGRDITYAYLKERGYQAFFLAIGAQKNNRLNIPGEDFDGVVDCMSLLLALNLKVDIFAGSRVVVIGGGNAAIDAARSTLRSGAKEVTVLYRRTREVMPANTEEVEEAIKEGIKLECSVLPVEILATGGKLSGLRCQRTTLANDNLPDNNHRLTAVSGTDSIFEADHVVVAIGQSPDASQLSMEGLKIDRTGVILVKPLTLETSLPGVFAGGDCITGPNNVVEAMANGLRAAESMDRYLRGQDLAEERSLELPPVAEIDPETVEHARHPRVKIPVIRTQKRLSTFEETTLGISAPAAQKETQRCLNCAECSQCLECTAVCELGAVCHEDTARHIDIAVEAILRFPEDEASAKPVDFTKLTGNMALALETAAGLKQDTDETLSEEDERKADTSVITTTPALTTAGNRLGVFLCRCGGSTSSVIDFKTLSRRLSDFPGVTCINEIPEACNEAGAGQIAALVAEHQLDRIVLAACRCCNLNQVCYSCTDRRQMCLQNLDKALISPRNTIVEFCNIREQSAWVYKDSPRDATGSAMQIITAGINRAQMTPPSSAEKATILPQVLILGGSPVNATAAVALTSRGYNVVLVSRQTLPEMVTAGPSPAENSKVFDLLTVKPWPASWQVSGRPGCYEIILDYGTISESVSAGAILVDMHELNKEPPAASADNGNDLLYRIISHRRKSALSTGTGPELLREVTIGGTAGLFVLPADYAGATPDLARLGLVTAARIAAFLEQGSLVPRTTAVNIDIARCRGCGNCADICPYIEMRQHPDGLKYAFVSRLLCLGCGACVTACPTGAITQAQQSDHQIISTLSAVLQAAHGREV